MSSVLSGAVPVSATDYSFGYWLNGWRKADTNRTPDILCLETGKYGFAIDVADFSKTKFGRHTHESGYVPALNSRLEIMDRLPPAEFTLELEANGTVFRATSCEAGNSSGYKQLETARLWESGRYVQHFDLQGLLFEDSAGRVLGTVGRLELVAWPESLTFNAEIAPSQIFSDGYYAGVNRSALCVLEKPYEIAHDERLDPEKITVEFWVEIPDSFNHRTGGWLVHKNDTESNAGYYGIELDRTGKVEAVMNIAGSPISIEQRSRALKEGEWNHLSLTYDGDSMEFFINGKTQGRKKVGLKRITGEGALGLGSRLGYQKRRARALYDDLRIWNRALNHEEIQSIASKPQLDLGNSDGLNFWQRFDVPESELNIPPVWNNVTMRLALKSDRDLWLEEKLVEGQWLVGEEHTLTLNCNISERSFKKETVAINFKQVGGRDFKTAFLEERDAFVATVPRGAMKRDWKTGYTDIRNYDEFEITINNTAGEAQKVPFFLDLYDEANITGVCPILCDAEGRPTGIHVQLSKNWHDDKLGSYVRAYALIPSAAGSQTYKLRFAYGFYGSLPSASHAQLSLVGYGGQGRWEQLAIGCWGETMCLDMDMSCVDVAITDVRMLMARLGAKGRKWAWTDAGWGGDWLNLADASGEKLYFGGLKTAYKAHGPCLTEVSYGGYYGSLREVDLDSTVRTLRTNDYARTFYDLDYSFNQPLPAQGTWLFKMGRTHNYKAPQIAYGNREGLIKLHDVPKGLKRGDRFLGKFELVGQGPWWISFPGGDKYTKDGKATGYRALVIRSYEAQFSGAKYDRPTISFPVHQLNGDGSANLDALLTLPPQVKEVQVGDSVKMELEWITLHREADDYYGANESYREHLASHPSSWKTTYREAIGNDLQVVVEGGELVRNYPIFVKVEQGASSVRVHIQGGVGYVPIRFEGLASATGYTLYEIKDGQPVALDQSVHGNDFWQVDFDAVSKTYSITYNLPLDGLKQSEWILRKLESE